MWSKNQFFGRDRRGAHVAELSPARSTNFVVINMPTHFYFTRAFAATMLFTHLIINPSFPCLRLLVAIQHVFYT